MSDGCRGCGITTQFSGLASWYCPACHAKEIKAEKEWSKARVAEVVDRDARIKELEAWSCEYCAHPIDGVCTSGDVVQEQATRIKKLEAQAVEREAMTAPRAAESVTSEEHEQRWRKLLIACNVMLFSQQAGPDLKVVVRKIMQAAGVEPDKDTVEPRPTCPDHPDSSPSSARSVGTGKRTWFCLVCARKLGPAPDHKPTGEGQDVIKNPTRSKP